MTQTKFDNGDKVRDKITGLTGIVQAVTIWINGCVRYVIQPQEIKDGKPVDTTSFDENDLEMVSAQSILPVGSLRGQTVSAAKGGPQNDRAVLCRE